MSRKAKPTYITSEYPFAKRLRALMDEKGTNQTKLAQHVGVTRQAISLYATGQSTPDIYILKKIAEFFEVSSDWLIGLSEYKSIENRGVTAAELGISEKAIDVLIKNVNSKNFGLIDTINVLLEQEEPQPTIFDFVPADCWEIRTDEKGREYSVGNPPDGVNAKDDFTALKKEWEEANYIPVLSRIQLYLYSNPNSKTSYLITENEKQKWDDDEWDWDSPLNKSHGAFFGVPSAGAFRKVKANDIINEMFLTDIRNCLVDLKKKEGEDNAETQDNS